MRLLIKEILAARNMDQKDLAALMGKSPSTVSLQLKNIPSVPSLVEMADALQVPFSDLFEVPDGYVHWTQREPYKTVEKPEYRCPHCGMQMIVTAEPEK